MPRRCTARDAEGWDDKARANYPRIIRANNGMNA